jgi:hypothetical protein
VSEIDAYLDRIKLKLVTSSGVAQYVIITERTTATDGYLHIGSEARILASELLNICQVLDILKTLIAET